MSGFAADTWNQVGTFLGEKSTEFSVWMSVSGNDALEKLKGIYDETAAEMGIETKKRQRPVVPVHELRGRQRNRQRDAGQADARRPCLCAGADAEGDAAQAALDLLLGSGITDQAAADAALASMLAANLEAPDPNEPRYYLGEVVNTGVDNGYSEAREIGDGDVHFGWTLGRFFVCGFTSVYEDENGDPVFIKTLGDQIQLWFELEQDIDCLNGRDALSICEDTNGFDEAFGISRTNLGRGAMITRHTDYQNAVGEPQLFTDYLSAITASGADTTVQLFEEGDYEVALDYEIKDQSNKLAPQYGNYRIAFSFSVRNGNCMVYPFDVATGAELTNTAVTENGFYLDLALSRYLDINVKREDACRGRDGSDRGRALQPPRPGWRTVHRGGHLHHHRQQPLHRPADREADLRRHQQDPPCAHGHGAVHRGSPRADRQGRANRGGRKRSSA